MKQYFGTPLYQWVILAIGIIVSNIIEDQFVLPWWAKLLVFGRSVRSSLVGQIACFRSCLFCYYFYLYIYIRKSSQRKNFR